MAWGWMKKNHWEPQGAFVSKQQCLFAEEPEAFSQDYQNVKR